MCDLIAAEQMVPGDIVLLEAGDAISADLRLVEASNLAADESTLTGESVAVEKTTRSRSPPTRGSPNAARCCSRAPRSRAAAASAWWSATGLATELGRVSQLVEEAEPGSSPLEKKLARLSGQLVWATIVLTALIAGVGLATGKDAFLMIEAAIALAVAAIPEGLPIVATLALARGMWRMARQNALIERLSAVETLGATTVILTDKTGTLTENRMTVRRFWLPVGRNRGRGASVANGGTTSRARRRPATRPPAGDRRALQQRHAGQRQPRTAAAIPMELALLRAGRRAGLERPALLQAHARPCTRHAFDTASQDDGDRAPPRRRLSVRGQGRAGSGAGRRRTRHRPPTATVVDGCAPNARNGSRRVELLGHHGLRVLACAMQDRQATPTTRLMRA